MIAQWMLYCLAVGALLSLGGVAAERALRAAGRPVRWAWLAAALLTAGLPAAARLLPREEPPAPVRTAAPAGRGDAVALDRLPAAPVAPRRYAS